MSIKPAPTTVQLARSDPYYLAPFDKVMAFVVAQWAQDDRELFWLAPKTTHPLTATKVVAWPGPDGQSILFHQDDLVEPLGYLELNPMPGQTLHAWVGHCILRPEQRGMGLGTRMVRLALKVAFVRRRMNRVSLVVFPDNIAAIYCYRSVGFLDAGEQTKYFHRTGREHRMLQMTIDLGRYRSLYGIQDTH